MGRYQENNLSSLEVSFSGRVFQVIKNPSEQTEVYSCYLIDKGFYKYLCYTLQEDGTWVNSTASWLNGDAVDENSAVVDIFAHSSGDYYAAYTTLSQDKENNTTIKSQIIVSKDGGKTAYKMDIPYIKDTEMSIERLAVTDDGTIVISDRYNSDYLLTFSSEGKSLDDITEVQNQGFMVYGNTIVGMNKDSTEVVFYNISDRKIEKQLIIALLKNQ